MTRQVSERTAYRWIVAVTFKVEVEDIFPGSLT